MKPTLRQTRLPTPLGEMRAVASDDGLLLLDFSDRRDVDGALDRLLARFDGATPIDDADHPHLATIRREMNAFFAGTSFAFTVSLLPDGTAFEHRCWDYLRTIPSGETRTYGQQASALGSAGASRAVGRANGMNFLAIVVPCHRVIGGSGKLTGYGGGLDRKAWLLDHERRHAALFAAR